MTFMKLKAAFACTLLLFACCQGEHRPETPEPERHLGLHKLTIGEAVVYVDVARTDAARQQGLMYRESMPQDEGMVFVYPDQRYLSFYMKNTLIALSIAYIDQKGVIRQILDMQPLDESSHEAIVPVQYALEVNQGWFQKNSVKVGDSVANLPSPEGAEE